jgi:hypothetical protein
MIVPQALRRNEVLGYIEVTQVIRRISGRH